MAQWVATRERCQLLAQEVSRVIAEAGQISGLTSEIGALRTIQARLINEEQDLHFLTEAIPRIVGAIIRALRTQHLLVGETAGDLTEMLTRILNEMGVGED